MPTARTKIIRIRVRSTEFAAWHSEAKLADKTLSEWLRNLAELEIRQKTELRNAARDRALRNEEQLRLRGKETKSRP